MRSSSLPFAPLLAAAALAAPLQAQAVSDFTQKLIDPQGASVDLFGSQVLIDGDHLVLTAPAVDNQGAAFAFRRVAGEWLFVQELNGSGTGAGDYFGSAADLQGDLLAVGSELDDSLGQDAGEAYLFEFNGSQWVQVQRIQAPDGDAVDKFGGAIALGGDLLVIGAFSDDHAGQHASGSAYVYRRSGSSYAFEQKLVDPTPVTEDWFGWEVATDGETIVASAVREEEGAIAPGAAYVFEFDGSAWNDVDRLTASAGGDGDSFGWDLALHDGRVAVGAPEHAGAGAVHVFERQGASWVETATLMSGAAGSGDEFGYSVALEGPVLIAGAPGKVGSPASQWGYGDGALLRFNHTPSGWVDAHRWLTGEVAAWFPLLPQLGRSCAFDGDLVVGGAPYAAGANGFPTGAAYLFDSTPLGLAAPDSVVAGQTATFETFGGVPTEPYGLALSGVGGAPIPPLLLDLQTFDALGSQSVTLPTPASLIGLELQFVAAGFWQTGLLGFSQERTVGFQ